MKSWPPPRPVSAAHGIENMWNQRYSEPGFAYGTDPNDFLVSSAPLLKPESEVLCLAEGEGRNAVYLAAMGHRVTAVDSSEVGLEKARSLAREHSVSIRTIVADLDGFAIEPEGFQAIVSIFCHLPSRIRSRLHHRVCGGLSPGGLFILEGYATRQFYLSTGGPRTKELLLDLDELTDELAGLHLSHAVEIERDIHEGRYHDGIGAVIQVIGSKPR